MYGSVQVEAPSEPVICLTPNLKEGVAPNQVLGFEVWGLGFGGRLPFEVVDGGRVEFSACNTWCNELQGYLTYKKTHPPRTLLWAYA